MRYVQFVTKDKTIRLRFDFNALADLEEKVGSGVIRLFAEEMVGFNTIRLLYWAGLKWEEPNLTISKAGKIVEELVEEGHSLQELANKLNEALQLSGLFGGGDEAKEADPFDKTQPTEKKLQSSKK